MDSTGGGEERYRKLQGAAGLSKNSETYVRFSVKYPHLRRRHDLAPRPLTGRQRIFNHRTSAAAHQPLSTGGTNAQGVDQISNGVSVLNLGQGQSNVVANPNPAAAAAAATSSGNNNY